MIFKNNKKGFSVSETAPDVFSSIAIFIIIAMFFFIFKFGLDDNRTEFSIASESSELDIDLSLNNLLLTPISTGGQSIPISSYIYIALLDAENNQEDQKNYQLFKDTIQASLNLMEYRYDDLIHKDKEISCRKEYTLIIDQDIYIPIVGNNILTEKIGYIHTIELKSNPSKNVPSVRPYCFNDIEKARSTSSRIILLANKKEIQITLESTLYPID